MGTRKRRPSFEEVFTEAGIIPEWMARGEEKKALEIARKLLNKGMSVEETADLATLSVEKVRAL
jgi:predicted transposase YdaD